MDPVGILYFPLRDRIQRSGFGEFKEIINNRLSLLTHPVHAVFQTVKAVINQELVSYVKLDIKVLEGAGGFKRMSIKLSYIRSIYQKISVNAKIVPHHVLIVKTRLVVVYVKKENI